ncbi:LysR family transcriptional regulator [Saccharopolyspora pogona]|uniref:LysR family transcriptional regulator n=1 Tax=Saccharopolyspora pogona TaxID=333966 RepID=UPI0016894716
MVELRHLVYFRTVAQLGSIAKAATALHMTQPTLSRQIAQLERTLGHQLLRRTSHGTSLTPAGESLRTHVGAILELTDRIPEVLHRAERGTRAIHIGMPPGVPREWFEALQTALRDARPDLRISLREATSEKQRVLLQQGVINIGLLHTEPRELQSVQVFSQRFGCAVREASRFGERRSVMLEDLAGLRVMAHSVQESPGKETRLRAAAEARGVQIDWAFRGYWEHAELVADSAEADVVLPPPHRHDVISQRGDGFRLMSQKRLTQWSAHGRLGWIRIYSTWRPACQLCIRQLSGLRPTRCQSTRPRWSRKPPGVPSHHMRSRIRPPPTTAINPRRTYGQLTAPLFVAAEADPPRPRLPLAPAAMLARCR